MSPVLVTGGSGYLGTRLIATLLLDERPVRTTVRSLTSEDEVRTAVPRGGADDGGLEIVAAELTSDEGWATAAAGCEEVHHTDTEAGRRVHRGRLDGSRHPGAAGLSAVQDGC